MSDNYVTIPNWLFSQTDLSIKEKWHYLCIKRLCAQGIYTASLDQFANDLGPDCDELNLATLAQKGLIEYSIEGEHFDITYTIKLVQRGNEEAL
jgi:hypothetical protein